METFDREDRKKSRSINNNTYLEKVLIYAGQEGDKYTYKDFKDILKVLLSRRDELFVGILTKGYKVTLQNTCPV